MTYERSVLLAWLGSASDQLTAEQIDQVAAMQRDIEQRYPHPDQYTEREDALTAAVQGILGETDGKDN